MPRTAKVPLDRSLILPLYAPGSRPADIEAKLIHFEDVISCYGLHETLGEVIIENNRVQDTLRLLDKALDAQQQTITKLTAKPHPVATYLGAVDDHRARVLHQSSERMVGFGPGLKFEELTSGDSVLLAEAGNVILERFAGGRGGELSSFERALPDGTLLVRHRDEQVVVRALGTLEGATLAPGDLVRIDRANCLAFGSIPRDARPVWLCNDPPTTTRDAVAGIDDCLDKLHHALTATLTDPQRAARYGLDASRTILLCGPPGVGKTLSTQWAVAELVRRSGRRCRFMSVKPGMLISKWVGETEANIRAAFAELRQAAKEDGMVVGYFDEIESIARIRGGALGQFHDGALAALLAEMDGFTKLENVALIFATNRKDMLDPAALERFASVEIRVPRPNARAAARAFGVHLPDRLPFSPNGSQAQSTRAELIESAVSRLYSPNGDNAVCRLRFRDGKDRVIAARELVSGRLIQQICRDAASRAFRREDPSGEDGIQIRDLDAALDDALTRLRTTLSINNAHAFLDDLPQDVAVVAAEPLGLRVKQPHRYLNP